MTINYMSEILSIIKSIDIMIGKEKKDYSQMSNQEIIDEVKQGGYVDEEIMDKRILEMMKNHLMMEAVKNASDEFYQQVPAQLKDKAKDFLRTMQEVASEKTGFKLTPPNFRGRSQYSKLLHQASS
jgi:hypothetical protein